MFSICLTIRFSDRLLRRRLRDGVQREEMVHRGRPDGLPTREGHRLAAALALRANPLPIRALPVRSHANCECLTLSLLQLPAEHSRCNSLVCPIRASTACTTRETRRRTWTKASARRRRRKSSKTRRKRRRSKERWHKTRSRFSLRGAPGASSQRWWRFCHRPEPQRSRPQKQTVFSLISVSL